MKVCDRCGKKAEATIGNIVADVGSIQPMRLSVEKLPNIPLEFDMCECCIKELKKVIWEFMQPLPVFKSGQGH